MPHYIKALAAASEDSQLDVFERIGQLGEAIKPRSNVFIPPPVGAHVIECFEQYKWCRGLFL